MVVATIYNYAIFVWVVILVILLDDSLEEEPDPSIGVLFTRDDMIDRCFRLPAVATVGPPNHDVLHIHAGIRIYAYYQECIIHTIIMLCHYYALYTGYIVIKKLFLLS